MTFRMILASAGLVAATSLMATPALAQSVDQNNCAADGECLNDAMPELGPGSQQNAPDPTDVQEMNTGAGTTGTTGTTLQDEQHNEPDSDINSARDVDQNSDADNAGDLNATGSDLSTGAGGTDGNGSLDSGTSGEDSGTGPGTTGNAADDSGGADGGTGGGTTN